MAIVRFQLVHLNGAASARVAFSSSQLARHSACLTLVARRRRPTAAPVRAGLSMTTERTSENLLHRRPPAPLVSILLLSRQFRWTGDQRQRQNGQIRGLTHRQRSRLRQADILEPFRDRAGQSARGRHFSNQRRGSADRRIGRSLSFGLHSSWMNEPANDENISHCCRWS